METPGKLDESRLTAKHRAAFNVQMFDDADGNCSSLNTKQSTSKAFSQVEYGRRMHILDPENWGVGDLREMIESDQQKSRPSDWNIGERTATRLGTLRLNWSLYQTLAGK